jgi:hypothetical protein
MFQVLLFSVALAALAVWAGRRALPRLKLQDWRIASGGLAALLFLGGLAASMKGSYPIGGGLMVAGLLLAFSARFRPRPRPRPLPKASDSEARAILGVGPDADEAEIQAAYSRLIRMAHPDAGGTTGLAAQLNAARDALLRPRR